MLSPARSPRLVMTSLSSLLVTALAACSSSSDQPKSDGETPHPSGTNAPAPAGNKSGGGGAAAQPQSQGTQELIQQKQQLLIKTALDNATALREQGNYDEARAQLEQVLMMDPANTQALVGLNERHEQTVGSIVHREK